MARKDGRKEKRWKIEEGLMDRKAKEGEEEKEKGKENDGEEDEDEKERKEE